MSNFINFTLNPSRFSSSIHPTTYEEEPSEPLKLNFAINTNFSSSQTQPSQTPRPNTFTKIQPAQSHHPIPTPPPIPPPVKRQMTNDHSQPTLHQSIHPLPLNVEYETVQNIIDEINSSQNIIDPNILNSTIEQENISNNAIEEIRDFINKTKEILGNPHAVLEKFNNLSAETQKDLRFRIWHKDGGHNNPSFGELNYGEKIIQSNPARLFDGSPSIIEEYLLEIITKKITDKLKEIVKRPQVSEIIKFSNESEKILSDPQAVLEKFNNLSAETQKDLRFRIWHKDGGHNNPSFGELNYGEKVIQSNPARLFDGSPSIISLFLIEMLITGLREDPIIDQGTRELKNHGINFIDLISPSLT